MARELLFTVGRAEFEVQTFRAGGKGGQNQNKRSTGVRIVHRASGARGEARDQRSQLANRKAAFRRLVASPQFRVWLAGRVKGEEDVARMMAEENLLVEVRRNGVWVPA